MLQIVTKMYFREGVPLNSTVHREVLYTNRNFLRMGALVELPVGELAPSTRLTPVATVMLSVAEHLEAQDPDGERSMLVATGGTDLVDQLADVLSLGLNSVFSRDGDLVNRLVPGSLEAAARSSASKLFRHTFDPERFVADAELEELSRFMSRLLGLRRNHFEIAMRAIRRIVHATQHATEDPTISYVDLVAAIESLSEGTTAPLADWDRLDARKRALVDEALEGADAGLTKRVREAVMKGERLGAKSRFVAFVMDNVSPEFFRSEAVGAKRPVRGADLERVVKLAYDIRSRNVHVLEDLPPEAWVLGDRADTVSPPDTGIMLSHEGLARLARHVLRSYVERAPAEVDETFNWRGSLPGIVRMQPAPQYWVWNVQGFDLNSVGRYFSGFVAHLADALAGRSESVADMQAVLERIEQLSTGTADGPDKALMVAIYAMWHSMPLAESDRRPDAAGFLVKHEPLLQAVGVASFVALLFTDRTPDWTADDWHTLATARRAERTKRRHLELPPSFDAALQAMATERLMEAGRAEEALVLAGWAVEELPGYGPLVDWEAKLVAGERSELNWHVLVLQLAPDADAQERPSPSGEDPAPPPEAEDPES